MSDLLIDRLKKHGKQIGEDAQNENPKAKTLIHYYQMWHRCPGDGMAQVLVEQSFDDWAQEKGIQS